MGTVTIAERPDSRTWNLGQPQSETSVTCQYLLRWVATTDPDPYPGDGTVLADALVPKPSDRPLSALHNSDAWVKLFVCRSVTLTPERSMPYAWNVTAVYSTMEVGFLSQGYMARQTRTAGTRTIEQYRTWTTLPTDGSPTYPPSDMGGTKVDWNGNPRQREIAQQTIQLEYTWDRTTASSTTATDPSFATFVAAQGKRNTDTIFGFVKGSLLYRGCQATLEEERWRLVHVWVFDDIYHLQQLPLPNATGAPILLPGITVAGQQILQADKVGWYQPYPDFVTWSGILPTEVYNELTKARPARI